MGVPQIQCPSCRFTLDISKSQAQDRNIVLTSCSNPRCDQYDKVKFFELPRIKVSTAKVEL